MRLPGRALFGLWDHPPWNMEQLLHKSGILFVTDGRH